MWNILFVTYTLYFMYAGATDYTFPPDFLFGLATSSYQIEGAWNEDGKGVNIWDTLTHQYPFLIADHSNGDVAADSYHLYKEDVKLLKDVGVNFYRFSISWARILPTGFANQINQAGIDHYNNVINELLANQIEPVVTIFHWELPQTLQDLGGVTNSAFVGIFEEYAEVLFRNFGDRVKWWITINEPAIGAIGYSNLKNSTGTDYYLISYIALLAHSKVYRLYERNFKPQQKGKISVSLNFYWAEPNSNSTEDQAAADRSLQFMAGMFAHPIFTNEGDFPAVVKERVAMNSAAEGYPKSRLPTMSQEDIALIRGSADFFALNHYSTNLVKDEVSGDIPSLSRDMGVAFTQNPEWESTGLPYNKVVPWGFRKLLVWITKNYNNPPILITENGYSDRGQLNDTGRIKYITSYTKEMLNAMKEDGSNVIGYTLWSLLDNFEWLYGYTQKFGIFYVDFNDPARKRTEKESAKVYAEMIKTRAIPPRYL